MKRQYLLGVDVGTYSSKGVLVSLDGTVVASHIVEHGMDNPAPGHFEHDADKVWWHDFVEISKTLLSTSGVDPKDILSIGTSGIGCCVLPIDKDGKPLRPGILYGVDTRAINEIDFLNDAIGQDKIIQTNGQTLSSQACGPKVLWIKNNEPQIFEKTRYFLTSEAYLVLKLTGKTSIDIFSASDYNPLFNLEKREWIPEYCDLIAPKETLPDLYWSCDIVGKVTRQAALETGLAEGTPVIAGTTDAGSEALSAGMAQDGDLMIMFGSSIFFILKTESMFKSENFWASNYMEEGPFALQGGMSTGGSLTRWFRDQFAQPELKAELDGGLSAYSSLAQLAEASPAGSNGLLCLPYFEGERTPINDLLARGVFFGLSLKHNRADMYRSILESVAYGIRHNLEAMTAEGVQAKRILAVGGGTKNSEWMRIVCDVAGIEMSIPKQEIGASYGDAFMAGVGAGVFKDLSEINTWVETKQQITPEMERVKVYDHYYEIYRDLYTQTAPLMHRLASRE